MSETFDLYQDLIVDHYKNPRHKGEIETPDAEALVYNPLCGDQVRLMIASQDGVLSDVTFTGKGCAISQASASILSELCRNRSPEEARAIKDCFVRMLRGDISEADRDTLGDAVALEGVKKFSARVKCAVLAWEALEQCLGRLPSSPSKA